MFLKNCLTFSFSFKHTNWLLLVLVTVVEILPKEKKQREEKTVVLGQCTLDLLPVIKGNLSHTCV